MTEPAASQRIDIALIAGCNPGASLLSQCGEIVSIIETINSADGPYAGADDPDASVEARLIQHLKCLVDHVTRTPASREDLDTLIRETTARTRVLDVVSTILSWDREGLVRLRVSISRDQEEIRRRLTLKPRRGLRRQRSSWIGRLAVW